MRKFFLFAAAFCFSLSTDAQALIVTNGETVQVVGNFNTNPDAFIKATLVVNSNVNVYDYPYPAFPTYFDAGATFDGLELGTCESNGPGPCALSGSPRSTNFVASPLFFATTLLLRS
jgi:hypothetical protein